MNDPKLYEQLDLSIKLIETKEVFPAKAVSKCLYETATSDKLLAHSECQT